MKKRSGGQGLPRRHPSPAFRGCCRVGQRSEDVENGPDAERICGPVPADFICWTCGISVRTGNRFQVFPELLCFSPAPGRF